MTKWSGWPGSDIPSYTNDVKSHKHWGHWRPTKLALCDIGQPINLQCREFECWSIYAGFLPWYLHRQPGKPPPLKVMFHDSGKQATLDSAKFLDRRPAGDSLGNVLSGATACTMCTAHGYSAGNTNVDRHQKQAREQSRNTDCNW